MLSFESVCLLATVFGIIYAWYRYAYSYWERNGIPFLKPIPLVGNAKVIFTQSKSLFMYLSDIYNEPKLSNAAAVGIYILNKPALVLREPELIKSVLIKDFQKFSNRSLACDPHGDALGAYNLFFLKNPKWKELRNKLTPLYTSAKVKQMYLLIQEIAIELEAHLDKQGESFDAEVSEMFALFTTDVIASIAFGIRANSMENPNGTFRMYGREIFKFTLERAFSFLIVCFYPKWASTFKIKIFSRNFSEFLRNTIDEVITQREKDKTLRNDLIDVLIELKKEMVANGSYNAKARDLLAAQAAIFFTAGFETSSSTSSFVLYELAKNPAIQKRLRKEICDAFVAENGKLSYDTIINLPYLSMVIDEGLRKYPVVISLDREHNPNMGDKPFDLRPYYDYTLPNDMPIHVPVYGLHHDKKYWPNPETFNPERFSPENKKSIQPMTYLPFGSGPRNCIGNRIGLLQSKVGLAHILKNHYVTVCDRTPKEISPDPLVIVLSHRGGIYLNIVKDGLYDSRATK